MRLISTFLLFVVLFAFIYAEDISQTEGEEKSYKDISSDLLVGDGVRGNRDYGCPFFPSLCNSFCRSRGWISGYCSGSKCFCRFYFG